MADEKKAFHLVVAEKLIDQLERGTAPWQKPWAAGESYLPYNPTTGKTYKGINSLQLLSEERADPRWLTYKQAQAEGAQVRRGEKGTLVQYWKFEEERAVKGDGRQNPCSMPRASRPKRSPSCASRACFLPRSLTRSRSTDCLRSPESP